MIPEAFLACALSMPPAMFKNPASAGQVVDKLRDFVRAHAPGAEISLSPEGQRPGKGWEWTPLKWGGLNVWIKRPPSKRVQCSA